MKTGLFRLIVLCVLLSVAATLTLGSVPRTLTLQGKLTDSLGQPVADGAQSVTFRIYDVETCGQGTPLWQEVQSVQTSDGIFNVNLGTVAPITLSFGRQYWLAMQPPSCGELCPRTRLTTAPYAVRAEIADTVPDGSITTLKIADNAVTDAKITAVDWSKILNAPSSMAPTGAAGGDLTGTYPNPSVAAGAVTPAKLGTAGATAGQVLTYNGSAALWATPSGSPTGAAGGDLSGTYPNPAIGAGKVTSAAIAGGAITPPKVSGYDKCKLRTSSTAGITYSSGESYVRVEWWDIEEMDTNNLGSSTGITIRTTGTYLINGSFGEYNNSPAGKPPSIQIRRNGVVIAFGLGHLLDCGSNIHKTQASVSTVVSCTLGDVIEMWRNEGLGYFNDYMHWGTPTPEDNRLEAIMLP